MKRFPVSRRDALVLIGTASLAACGKALAPVGMSSRGQDHSETRIEIARKVYETRAFPAARPDGSVPALYRADLDRRINTPCPLTTTYCGGSTGTAYPFDGATCYGYKSMHYSEAYDSSGTLTGQTYYYTPLSDGSVPLKKVGPSQTVEGSLPSKAPNPAYGVSTTHYTARASNGSGQITETSTGYTGNVSSSGTSATLSAPNQTDNTVSLPITVCEIDTAMALVDLAIFSFELDWYTEELCNEAPFACSYAVWWSEITYMWVEENVQSWLDQVCTY